MITYCSLLCAGTSVFQVTASDADDPTYGNSAMIVYSILEGQPYFSVDPKTGKIASVFTFKQSVKLGNTKHNQCCKETNDASSQG